MCEHFNKVIYVSLSILGHVARVRLPFLFLCLVAFCAVDCSSTQKKAQLNSGEVAGESDEDLPVSDPLEGMNRKVHAFNDFFLHYFLEPVASGWNFITPRFLRVGIDNFFNWFYTPSRLISNLLQAKFVGAGKEIASFTINGTMGGLGFYDASKEVFALERTNEDMDQALGKWGISEGAYIVLPFIGPRTVRGTFGFAGDLMLQPQTVLVPEYVGSDFWTQSAFTVGGYTVRAVNAVSLAPGEYDNLMKDSIDPYSFLRDIYLQNTRKNVAD